MRIFNGIVLTLAIATLAGCVGPAHAATPSRVQQSGWHVVRLGFVPPRGAALLLLHLHADAISDAWATGIMTAARQLRPLLDHWNGAAWHQAVLPAPVRRRMGQGALWTALDASSPRNAWIFGQTPAETAFGSASHPTGARTYAWLYGHGRWARTALPGPAADVVASAAVTTTDICAMESRQQKGRADGGGALLHHLATRWQRIPLPAGMSPSVLADVVPCGVNCAWVGGSISNSAGTRQAAARWTGARWIISGPRVRPASQRLSFTDIASDGRGGLWASGYNFRRGKPRPVLWHYAHRRWTPVTFDKRLLIGGSGQLLAGIPGTTSLWATAEKASDPEAGELLALIARR